MVTQQISAADAALAAALELRPVFKGPLLFQNDPGYDAARSIWNGMIDRKPAVIAQCRDAHDIAAAIRFARIHDLLVSVRGGGHNVAGNAVCDDGLMIDLSQMKAIRVDPEAMTATAEPGVIWSELDKATLQFGLATTGGTVSDTGIAGLTLGGGLGWLMGLHGTTCDNLLSAEVVTASGDIMVADEQTNTDLFWAIRGGGGNFGVVSRFTYRLHRAGPTVFAGMILYPMEQGKAVLQHYRNYVRQAPDALMSYAGFIVTPDGMPVTFVLPAWMGPLNEAEQHLVPLRSFGTPLADMVGEMEYQQLQSILDAACPTGIRRYWKAGYLQELQDELLDIYLQHLKQRPSPNTAVLFYHMKGAAIQPAPDATAFPHRFNQWDTDIISQWIDPADDATNIAWTRAFWNDIAPFTNGVYVNHLDGDDGNDRVRMAYQSNYARLKEIKRKYDPENMFRMNNNIAP